MIKTPLSAVIGGAFWTPSATILGSTSKTFNQLIKSIFANNEQGFAYDPNDLSTMFQDAAGTVPVTGAGQPVGLVKDKSGRNNHAYQANAASRPLLQRNSTTGAYYLAFDGSDDFLVTSSINFTATDKISLFAGVRKLSDAASAMLVELSTSTDNISNKGSFTLGAPYAVTGYGFQTLGSGVRGGVRTGGSAPTTDVVVGYLDLGATNTFLAIRPKRNGIFESTTFGGNDGKGGNFGNYPLYIGRRGGTILPFSGHIYSLIGVARLATDSETAAIEKELAKRTGVTLSV